MRTRGMGILAAAGLAAALAAKPTQLVAVRNSSRHGRSEYDKRAASARRELHESTRSKTRADLDAMDAAQARRERRARHLSIIADSGGIQRA